ncbi:MAG TPA: transglutaminase-like domain-containing protein [Thermoanaerobaculia bacterium]|nr:transglutaminase-like domain-containing protein [Thermoanaerobaculia bacterium]
MSETVFIHPAEARRRFEEFANGEIDDGNLVEGALLIALEEYPAIDVESYVCRLDELADRIAKRGSPEEPDIFRLGHLHYELFDIEGFSGNESDYYDVRNSFLNEVIDRKLGLPITLSIVFLHVAHRVGMTASGVGLPGHFIVKVQFPLSEIYVDPFHAGRTLTIGEIDTMIGEMSGGEMRLRSQFLRGWSGREILVRVLSNLQKGYQRSGDKRKALSAEERIAILSRFAGPVETGQP